MIRAELDLLPRYVRKHTYSTSRILTGFAMEQRRPPEYILEVFADPTSVKDVVKGWNVDDQVKKGS